MLNDYASFEETTMHKHLICWKSAFAGLALAILTFTGVLALAIAFGGIGLEDGAAAKSAGILTSLSIVAALILANFVGSYFSVRVAKLRVDVIGVMQGLLVGSLFLIFVLWQTLAGVGAVGKVAGTALGASASMAGAGISVAAQSPLIEGIIEDNLGDLKLKSEPKEVFRGVASRLLRGDQESAKKYLVYQSGMTPADADQKIAAAKVKVDETIVETRKAAATALKAVGWSLFVSIVLATISSVLGGLAAALCNNRCLMDSPNYRKKNI